MHQYWRAIIAGAEKAERDLFASGTVVKVESKAPLREDDHEAQAEILDDFLRRGVDGIVLAPFKADTLAGPVEAAARAGAPTVVVDSALNTTDIVSFIATNNRKAGALAADRMGELLGGSGKVLVLRYQKGSASTEERERGFIDQLTMAYRGLEVVASEQYAGATRDTARRVASDLLGHYRKQLHGVFTPNESSTAGMLMALQLSQGSSPIALVGFDSSDVYLDSLRYGKIPGLVVQNPFRMGELGVKTLVEHIEGSPVAKHVDTGATMVTSENMDTPEIRKLLRRY